MNVLAMKAEPQWPFYDHGPADYRAFKAQLSTTPSLPQANPKPTLSLP